MSTESLLAVIAVLLFLILLKISNIDARMKERLPTEKEADRQWGLKDPLGHAEAHKDDKGK